MLRLFFEVFVKLGEVFIAFLFEHFWVENVFEEVKIFLSIVIEDTVGPWSHICNINVVSLLNKFSEGSAHWNNIVVGMRRKKDNFFGIVGDPDDTVFHFFLRLVS